MPWRRYLLQVAIRGISATATPCTLQCPRFNSTKRLQMQTFIYTKNEAKGHPYLSTQVTNERHESKKIHLDNQYLI